MSVARKQFLLNEEGVLTLNLIYWWIFPTQIEFVSYVSLLCIPTSYNCDNGTDFIFLIRIALFNLDIITRFSILRITLFITLFETLLLLLTIKSSTIFLYARFLHTVSSDRKYPFLKMQYYVKLIDWCSSYKSIWYSIIMHVKGVAVKVSVYFLVSSSIKRYVPVSLARIPCVPGAWSSVLSVRLSCNLSWKIYLFVVAGL